jgi:hypothetical protein
MPTQTDKTNQTNDHNRNMKHIDNTHFFYKRAALDAFNLSAGILITVIMIFRLQKSNI